MTRTERKKIINYVYFSGTESIKLPNTLHIIYEPKERIIFRLPYYPDRITHHAIMNIMESIWVKIFTRDTYSCIKNRGIHALL